LRFAGGVGGRFRAGDRRVRLAQEILLHRALRAALDGLVRIQEALELLHALHGELAAALGTRELIELDGIGDLAGIAVRRGDAVEGLPEAGSVASGAACLATAVAAAPMSACLVSCWLSGNLSRASAPTSTAVGSAASCLT